jgi:proteasome alpha subunit
VGDTTEENLFFKITYDGTLFAEDHVSAIGGQEEQLTASLKQSFRPDAPLGEAVRWAVAAFQAANSRSFEPNEWEAAVVDRTLGRRAFRRLTAAEMDGA